MESKWDQEKKIRESDKRGVRKGELERERGLGEARKWRVERRKIDRPIGTGKRLVT